MSQTKAQLVEGFNINPSAPADTLVIDSSGRLGLGTSSPSALLQIQGAGSFSTTFDTWSGDFLFVDSTNTLAGNGRYGPGISWGALGTSNNRQAGISSVQTETDSNRVGLAFFTHPSTTASSDIVEALRINHSGNVGIGTTNPSQQKLTIDVNSNNTTAASFNGINVCNTDNTTNNGSVITFGQELTGNSSARIGAINTDHTNGSESQDIFFGTIGAGTYSERARIDSSGRFGLGTAEPVGQAYIAGPNTSNFGVAAEAALNLAALNGSLANRIVNLNFAVVPTATNAVAAIGMEYGSQSNFGNGDLIFGTRSVTTDTVPSVRMRISAQGNVGIGVDPSEKLHVDVGAPASSDKKIALFQSESSRQVYIGWDDSQSAMAIGTNTNHPLTFHINGQNAERFRINTNGDVTTTGDSSFVRNTNGFTARAGNESVSITRTSGTPLEINRNTNDGNLVNWFRGGTAVGDISVSNGTVSYNPFLGSHWARLEDDSKPEILVGTVLETINKLIDWRIATFTVNGEQKISTYHGPANVGDTVQIEYEGQTYDAIVSLEEDPTNSLNKHVCVKVSDTAASAGVYGVFLGWDEDVQSEYINTWNDLYCAAVGNYFIRIAAGQTVAIGDLIESDGNGCGVVQSDDIIRSKTVGKVTSTIPQETYDDGSFLVTCVLCCG